MYSSIDENERINVIKKCYCLLFKLADLGVPIGIEAPAVTLEIINELDSDWISSLSKYIAENKIEFIGSGYSQIIGPLVPAKVNEWNQKLGLESYNKFFGLTPNIALVNEMAYSGGIVEHYQNAGYDGLIMEWNNPRSAHPEWENDWRYHPQKAMGNDGATIPLIWADSIAFQKFQRYTHGEYELKEYIQYLKSHIGNSGRFFPIYSNDVEIFDYRPGRYKTETQINGNSEWDRIIELYTYLSQQGWCEFVFPSQVLSGLNNEMSGKELKLESPSQPIPVKKQEKYNINRWALSGRDDLSINTKCYQIYNYFIKARNDNVEDWKQLCYFWSSDFRTHITEKRWAEIMTQLSDDLRKWGFQIKNKNKENPSINDLPYISEEGKCLTIENDQFRIKFNKNKGLTIQDMVFKNLHNKSLLGSLDHGYYDDISLGADYYSGHTVIERPAEHKVTDLGKISPRIMEEGNGITLKTKQKWGNYDFSYSIELTHNRIILKKIIKTDISEKSIIRPYHFTFNPEAWDQDSLYLSTHNGGYESEKFTLKGQNITHTDIYSSLISARHGFANTEGSLVIGDQNKKLKFQCEMQSAALIPSILYKEQHDKLFFRLQYSAREMDETIKPAKTLEINTKITINV